MTPVPHHIGCAVANLEDSILIYAQVSAFNADRARLMFRVNTFASALELARGFIWVDSPAGR
jgi:hypothetical protein